MPEKSLAQRLLKRWPVKKPLLPQKAVLDASTMEMLYQPIISLQSGAIEGHEAIVRGAKDSETETPQTGLDSAEAAQLHIEMELACAGRALQGWGGPQTEGRLYINVSAQTLAALSEPKPFQRLEGLLLAHRIPGKKVVIEVSRHRKLKDLSALERTITALQGLGCTIALDDVKASQRSLDLWLRLKPSVVKLDSRMTLGLQEDPVKAKVLRTLSNLAFKTGASLVAKAVEDADELRIVRDAGVHLAQGNFLGFPAPAVVDTLNLRARNVLAEKWSPPEPTSQPGDLGAPNSGLQRLVGMRWFD
jgi:EAL domain-containing protein (putative c-di-GMP-specific phosphodiesterase class I)